MRSNAMKYLAALVVALTTTQAVVAQNDDVGVLPSARATDSDGGGVLPAADDPVGDLPELGGDGVPVVPAIVGSPIHVVDGWLWLPDGGGWLPTPQLSTGSGTGPLGLTTARVSYKAVPFQEYGTRWVDAACEWHSVDTDYNGSDSWGAASDHAAVAQAALGQYPPGSCQQLASAGGNDDDGVLPFALKVGEYDLSANTRRGLDLLESLATKDGTALPWVETSDYWPNAGMFIGDGLGPIQVFRTAWTSEGGVSQEVVTRQKFGESLESFAQRHAAGVEALQSVFPPSGGQESASVPHLMEGLWRRAA